jgi:exopolysaccharide production protein ExoQ
MSPSFATIVYVGGIIGLFYLDRNRSVRTAHFLWLPVIWIWIIGSRPVSQWLGLSGGSNNFATQLVEGSPYDAAIFGILLAAGIVVLIRRRTRTYACLIASWPIVVYFAYCLLSVLWSDFPDIAFKRWIKAIGDLVMALVVVTDTDPVAAVGRLISRVGFILMPASVLFIKYFGDLGRGYDPDGRPMNTGVTTNKNILGVITLVVALGTLWSFLDLLFAKHQPNRARHLLARGTLLAFCIAVLAMADSATSVACFSLGTVLILATHFPMIRRRPGAMHGLVAMILLAGGLAMLLGGQTSIVHALGRKSNLTGRTDIWACVLPVAPNPVVGAGFESFWLGPRLGRVWSNLARLGYTMRINEAHNGYIEVYLNLGLVGVSLIAISLINGYRGSIAAFRSDPPFGGLMLAYIIAAAIYSVSEAGFRMLDPMWIFLLLAVVGAHTIAFGGVARRRRRLRSRERHVAEPSATNAFASAL